MIEVRDISPPCHKKDSKCAALSQHSPSDRTDWNCLQTGLNGVFLVFLLASSSSTRAGVGNMLLNVHLYPLKSKEGTMFKIIGGRRGSVRGSFPMRSTNKVKTGKLDP